MDTLSNTSAGALREFGDKFCSSIPSGSSTDLSTDKFWSFLSSFHDGARRKACILSKHPRVVATVGKEDSSDCAGLVNKDIMASDMKAWAVDNTVKFLADAWIVKIAKVNNGPSKPGVEATALVSIVLSIIASGSKYWPITSWQILSHRNFADWSSS